MDTAALKKFAQSARRQLREQVAARLEHVLRVDTAELRERQGAIAELREQIKQSSKAAVIDRVAYTWFNRFCALRYMDVNHYTRVGVVSPLEGFTQPEILQEAKQGLIDPDLPVNLQRVLDLLSGKLPSSNPQQEAYRLLLVATCNLYYKIMPFMFEKIEDYTELLMPEDLLSENSVLQAMRGALTEENCQDVEVIGWLYQFYISERKDEVFENLKKNIKIEAEDIPAATQLFTPHWIVRYLVENSLGRLWMLNHPDSRLVEQMEYYIPPDPANEPLTTNDYLLITSPEEIKICDPACGSGHMLTYAFDLLCAIYEESGYDPVQIPCLILAKNLYGIEICPRAGALASFALFMKARSRDRRFFSHLTQPNICVLENVSFTHLELDEYMSEAGRDLFTAPLLETLKQFEQAETFGSLIRPVLTDATFVRKMLQNKNIGGDIFLFELHLRVMKVLDQIEYLSPRYHVVVANPPYMGVGGMNDELKEFARNHYTNSKSDLFAMFIERGFELIFENAFLSMVTMQNWMFLKSFQTLRLRILNETTIICLVNMASMVMGIAFGTVATVWQKKLKEDLYGHYSFVDYDDLTEENIPYEFPVRNNKLTFVLVKDFKKIPGFPISYWIRDIARAAFEYPALSEMAESGGRCKTHNDELFVRFIWEVDNSKIGRMNTWCILYKGGPFRKFYGNRDWIFKWTDEAKEFYKKNGGLTEARFWERTGITWTIVTSKEITSFRLKDYDGQYSSVSPTIFSRNDEYSHNAILGLLNSIVANYFLSVLNPTLALNVGDVMNFPIPHKLDWEALRVNTTTLIEIAKNDWLSQESSWDFTTLPLLHPEILDKTIRRTYTRLRTSQNERITKTKQLEMENNKICIKAYGLQDILTPDVSLHEITLSCNPNYRFGGKKSEEELETLLLSDTMIEYISFAVGCMFGRFSMDKPGLILANQGETAADYHRQIPNPTFPPDEDNIIPILDEGWFADDITERFKKFLRITFGEEHYEENLAFLEEAIGKDVRSYFLKDFFSEHLKMYKKRPIYWQFSSPSSSFNALIYMHRYRPDTVSVVLSYLREYIQKLHAYKAHQEQVSITFGASQSEKTKALKEVNRVNKVLAELKEYEDDVLYPLATQRIEIDLDDGVKVNYAKFGKALRKISF